MSDLKLGAGFAFERGIDNVVDARGDDLPALPQLQNTPPCELPSRPRVDAILLKQTLDDMLDQAVSPELVELGLMAPARFRQALDHTRAMLRERTAAMRGNANPDEDGAARMLVLDRAAHLLDAECDLRNLVQMYRSVLYQG